MAFGNNNMKTQILLILIVISSFAWAKDKLISPKIPSAIYTGYTNVHYSGGGRTKTGMDFYSDPHKLINDLRVAKYLGADLTINITKKYFKDDRRDVFDQYWTLTISKTHFMTVAIYSDLVSKKRICCVKYFDNLKQASGVTVNHNYWYQLSDFE